MLGPAAFFSIVGGVALLYAGLVVYRARGGYVRRSVTVSAGLYREGPVRETRRLVVPWHVGLGLPLCFGAALAATLVPLAWPLSWGGAGLLLGFVLLWGWGAKVLLDPRANPWQLVTVLGGALFGVIFSLLALLFAFGAAC